MRKLPQCMKKCQVGARWFFYVQDARMSWVQGSTGATMCRTHVCRGCKEAQERRCAGRTYVVGARKHRNDDVQDARMSWVQGSTGATMCRTNVCRGCKDAQERRFARHGCMDVQERRCKGHTYIVNT
jgi:hypothetical protein